MFLRITSSTARYGKTRRISAAIACKTLWQGRRTSPNRLGWRDWPASHRTSIDLGESRATSEFRTTARFKNAPSSPSWTNSTLSRQHAILSPSPGIAIERKSRNRLKSGTNHSGPALASLKTAPAVGTTLTQHPRCHPSNSSNKPKGQTVNSRRLWQNRGVSTR